MQLVKQYSDKFDCLIQLSKNYNLSDIASELKSESDKLKNEYLYLVVIGQFKRGKSTLINALIGNDLLPTAVLPLTSIITMIKFGEQQQVKIIFEDESVLIIPHHELHKYITESGNPKNEKMVKIVEILFPSEFLKDGIVLIDTPGIGSLFLHNTKSTEMFVPKVDAAIFVLSIDPPITQTEFLFYEDVHSNVDKFYFVMNKVDLVDKISEKEMIEYTTNILSSTNLSTGQVGNNTDLKIFPISAKLALDGRLCNDKSKLSSSGILSLENEIKDSIRSEKFSILQNSVKRKFDKYISQLSFSIELEQNALQTPLDIFEDKIRKFNLEMDQIAREKKLALYNFNGEINDLITTLWDKVNEFSNSYSQTLYKNLSDYLISLNKSIRRTNIVTLARSYFASKISSDFEEWRVKTESDLIRKYSYIVEQSIAKINELIKRITEISANLFDISSPLLLDSFVFKSVSKFSYKTKDDLLFLEIDIYKLIPYFISRKLLLSLILKKMKKEISDKSGLNSGSIMGFYRTSIDEASLKFKYEMDGKIDQVIAYINSVVSAALKSKGLSEQLISKKLEKINDDLTLLNSLKTIEN